MNENVQDNLEHYKKIHGFCALIYNYGWNLCSENWTEAAFHALKKE